MYDIAVEGDVDRDETATECCQFNHIRVAEGFLVFVITLAAATQRPKDESRRPLLGGEVEGCDAIEPIKIVACGLEAEPRSVHQEVGNTIDHGCVTTVTVDWDFRGLRLPPLPVAAISVQV